MCDHHPREPAMPVIAPGVWCDPCLVPLVQALNESGIPTVASCCGHGRRPSSVCLADGRVVLILDDLDAYREIAGLWPGINDEPATVELRRSGTHQAARVIPVRHVLDPIDDNDEVVIDREGRAWFKGHQLALDPLPVPGRDWVVVLNDVEMAS